MISSLCRRGFDSLDGYYYQKDVNNEESNELLGVDSPFPLYCMCV